MKAQGIIGDPSTWSVARQSGKLVSVQIRPGQFVKMYEEDARARGLLPREPEAKAQDPEEKEQPKSRDKARRPAANKGA